MSLKSLLGEAIFALKSNSTRTVLTSLGIMVGIAAVILATSVVGGIKNMLYSDMGLENSSQAYIVPNSQEYVLSGDTLEQLKDTIDAIDETTLVKLGTMSVSSGVNDKVTSILGVESNFFRINGATLEEGYYFSSRDNQDAEPIVIIGPGIVEEVLRCEISEAIGKTVRIESQSFTVVGVLESDSSIDSFYSAVITPENTASKRLRISGIAYAVCIFLDDCSPTDYLESIESFLGAEYELEDASKGFTVSSIDSLLEIVDIFSVGFGALMLLVASTSLIVAGVSIMNMMLTSVAERRSEIGLRIAIGARKESIECQFLLESILICVLGGLSGFLIGLLLSETISFFVRSGMKVDFNPEFSPEIIFLSLALCLLVGICFGMFPAKRAAALNPIDALRD